MYFLKRMEIFCVVTYSDFRIIIHLDPNAMLGTFFDFGRNISFHINHINNKTQLYEKDRDRKKN